MCSNFPCIFPFLIKLMLERTNQLAAENVTLKASLDEMTSLKASLEDRCQACNFIASSRILSIKLIRSIDLLSNINP